MKTKKIRNEALGPPPGNLPGNLNNIQSSLVQNSDLIKNLNQTLSLSGGNLPNANNEEVKEYSDSLNDFSKIASDSGLHLQHTPMDTETTSNMTIKTPSGSQINFDKTGSPEADINTNMQTMSDEEKRDTLLNSLSAILMSSA